MLAPSLWRLERSPRRGMTYIEITISSMLLAVGMLGTIMASSVAGSLRRTAETELIASTRLSEAIEIVRERANQGDLSTIITQVTTALQGGPTVGSAHAAPQLVLPGLSAMASDIPSYPAYEEGRTLETNIGVPVTPHDYNPQTATTAKGAPIVVRFYVDENAIQPPVDLNGNGIAGDAPGYTNPSFPYNRVLVIASVSWASPTGPRSLAYSTIITPRP